MPGLILRRRVLSLAPRRELVVASTPPTFVGFATGIADPLTLPAHIADDLILGSHQRNAATVAVFDAAEDWNVWVSAQTGVSSYTGTSGSISLAYKIAADAAEAWGTMSVGTGGRRCWIYRDAAPSNHNGSITASSTALAWPALTLEEDSIVIAGLFCNTAQSPVLDMTMVPDGGFTGDRLSDSVGLCVDTENVLLSSFGPGGPQAISDAAIHNQFVAAIKAAA